MGWFAPHCSPCFLGKKTCTSHRVVAQIHGTDKWHSWRRKPAYWLQSQKLMSQSVLCFMIQLQASTKTILHISLHHVFINFLRGSHRAEPCKKISVVGWEPWISALFLTAFATKCGWRWESVPRHGEEDGQRQRPRGKLAGSTKKDGASPVNISKHAAIAVVDGSWWMGIKVLYGCIIATPIFFMIEQLETWKYEVTWGFNTIYYPLVICYSLLLNMTQSK